jgi:hypothetical protein
MRPDRASAEKRPQAILPRVAKDTAGTSPAVASVLGLQRTAGNAAVTDLLAIQRQPGPTTRRPGEQWAYGPITARKSKPHDLANFVDWIHFVEQGYGPDKQAILQRLRRLYYSSYSGKAGTDFDQVIEDQAGASGPPLDSRFVGTSTLDGLFETDTVRTLTGQILDPGHILAAIDVRLSGITTKAAAAEAVYGVPWTGIVTWAGDLASWFVEWTQQVRKIEGAPPPPPTGPATDEGPVSERGGGPASDVALFNTVGASKASKADILGDMDAQVLAAKSIQSSTPDSVRAEKRQLRANVKWELTGPVSKIIEQYYGFGMGRDKPTEAEGRFPAFVRSTIPPIPHKAVAGATGANGSIVLTSGAETAIYDAIRNTARLFIDQRTSDNSDPVKRYDGRIREIARRFTKFLEAGLKSGDAPWP